MVLSYGFRFHSSAFRVPCSVFRVLYLDFGSKKVSLGLSPGFTQNNGCGARNETASN